LELSGRGTTLPAMDTPSVCVESHPRRPDLICEIEGSHPQHAAFDRGWIRWDNEAYVAPVDPKTKLASVARQIRAARKEESEERFAATRSLDPETSHQAPKSLGDITSAQARVLRAIQGVPEGFTHDELIKAVRSEDGAYSVTDSSIRTRCRELVDLGLVEYAGRMRHSDHGNAARVWIAA